MVVEVKYRPRALEGVRAALFDSMSYREAYRGAETELFALGVAWGTELTPAPNSDLLVCTVDTVDEALRHFVTN